MTIDIPSQDKAWLEKVGQAAPKTEKPQIVKKDEE
jgi:hypothetical protein